MALCLNKKVENELRALPGNNTCCDCQEKNPQWASVSFGVFMCLECSGRHRALGVHISFVRSVSMDSWSDKQIQMMRLGGNDKCIKFLNQYGVSKETAIPQKYNSPAALLYRDRLSAEIEGRPLPTELPVVASSNSGKGSDVAQGTDPLPGETEAQYVARQRKLQEEARERMRQKFGGSTGLSSSGKMQGLGSNPNYNPNAPQSGGLDLNEAGQRAYSIFSSSIAMIGDTVAKTAQSFDTGNTNNGSSTGSGKQQPNQTWSLLSAGAVDLWKSATVATADIVGIITAPADEEADLKFPRPPSTNSYGNNSNIANNNSSSYSNKNISSSSVSSLDSRAGSSGNTASRKNQGGSLPSNGSWDNLDDVLQPPTPPQTSAYTSSSNSNREYLETNTKLSGMKLSDPSRANGTSSKSNKFGHGQSSTDSLNEGHSPHSASPLTTQTPNGQHVSAKIPTSTSKTVLAPSPVGDDFFATFGI